LNTKIRYRFKKLMWSFDILFRIRKSIKVDNLELINPLKKKYKINKVEYLINYLDEKFASPGHLEENDEEYSIIWAKYIKIW